MRCDANVSVRNKVEPLGTRCEIKNLNSIRNVVKAIEYEGHIQVELLESGEQVKQQTKLFDTSGMVTKTMRSKENANDYRYFPDPDLLPLKINDQYIQSIKNMMPELPDQKIARYVNDFGLSKYDAEVIVSDIEIAEYFEVASKNSNAKLVANWISSELFGKLNKTSMTLKTCEIKPKQIGQLIQLIESNVISGKIAKKVFEAMFESGKDPEEIVEEQGLKQVTRNELIEPIIDNILTKYPDKVNEYRDGKEKLLPFFVGQVMKDTAGKANPQIVNQLLKSKLLK